MAESKREGNCLLEIAKKKNRDCIKPEDIAEALEKETSDKVQEDLLQILAFFLDVEVKYPIICIQVANKELILSKEELWAYS